MEDLRRQLAAAQFALDEARARSEGGTAQTAGALALAEAGARDISDQLVASGQAVLNLEENIAAHQEMLGALRRGLVVAEQTRDHLRGKADEAGESVTSLRVRLERERQKFAPLVAAREREVARLERRVATVESYHPERRMGGLLPVNQQPTMTERFAAARAAETLAATAPGSNGSPGRAPAGDSAGESGGSAADGVGAPPSLGDLAQAQGGAP